MLQTVQTPGSEAGSQSPDPIVDIRGLEKTYEGGFQALKGVDLTLERGEILALLGPNGAGKTTLISAICGITVPTAGSILVDGHDIIKDYRTTRRMIGLVPQEITIEPFETVMNSVRFSRGLFGMKANDAYLESLLETLSLGDKKTARVRELSGGMKRRVLIAKALAHEPRVLFLDEPTAGVDVELRRDMWQVVRKLREDGVSIVLTTHYIEEAEAIADRVAIISKGRILLVEDKDLLLGRMGRRSLRIDLDTSLEAIPEAIQAEGLTLDESGQTLHYTYDIHAERTGIATLMRALNDHGHAIRDVSSRQSTLEEIFVELVEQDVGAADTQGDRA